MKPVPAARLRRKFGQTTPTWQRLGQWCWVAAKYWQFEWRCELPPRGSRPSAELEKAVDIACLQLLANPKGKLRFGRAEEPWILQRLIFAGALCQAVGRDGGVPLGQPQEALKIILVAEWRHKGLAEFLKLPRS